MALAAIQIPDFGKDNKIAIDNIEAAYVIINITAYGRSEVIELHIGDEPQIVSFTDSNGDVQYLIAELKDNTIFIDRTNSGIVLDEIQFIPIEDYISEMSLFATTQNSAVTAADWNTLKTNINNEAIRRNQPGAVGPVTARATSTAVEGSKIMTYTYNNFEGPLNTIASGLTNATAGSTYIVATGIGSYKYIQDRVTTFASYMTGSSKVGSSTGCASSCTGFCSTGCYSGCSGCSGCSGACQRDCTGCSSTCTGGCSSYCDNDCDSSQSFNPGCYDCC